ncbi:GNAT family N-acetyltransferase [Chryseobacterium geocarposphaerae]|uniref:Acetyltransferase (GNAT) family protein n=1 Tax=Chryseobacterium geocarposphaerae TaxID=1416776 RepID=A0A2M9BYE3_9FLAO|nr:GNAT family N-acetyltransferase [Chryseobacterium geocarposphaerae]PJJ63103.1 acetyltransferase (GNAT) family protein [Chryseobacterium geocarposphaerae]
MVHLKFFLPEDLAGLRYVLDEKQSLYTSTAEQALERIKERGDDLAFPVSIFDDEKVAGFLVLDFGADKFDITDNPNSVLLRSLSINPEFQGKGIGKSAMLVTDEFVKKHFSTCDEIVLAVNQNNRLAYEIYLKTGYSYDGKMREGRSGPQYLMYKKL